MNYLLWLIYCLLQVCTFKHESYPLTSHAVVTTILLYVCFITSLTIFSSVAQSYLTLRPHGLQHTRLPCSSPIPRVYSNSCPLSQWCHLILCHPLLLLPSIFPSVRVFSNESALCFRWPKNYSFSFSINPSDEYAGLISFWMNWFDLLAVQGNLKSLLQYHSSKESILWGSAFFIVQLSHPYMTPGKTIAFCR